MVKRETSKVPPPRSNTRTFFSQEGVSVGGDHLEDSIVDGQKGNVESSTTKIEYKNILLPFFLVHTVSNSCGSRFVNDPHNSEASDHSSILGSLSLGVIEICRYSHDSVGDLLAQESLGSLLHLGQDHGADLLGGEGLGSLAGFDLHVRLRIFIDGFEGIEFDVVLYGLV